MLTGDVTRIWTRNEGDPGSDFFRLTYPFQSADLACLQKSAVSETSGEPETGSLLAIRLEFLTASQALPRCFSLVKVRKKVPRRVYFEDRIVRRTKLRVDNSRCI